MTLQSGKRIADATYRSNTHFPVLPSYFHSALHGCIKYEDDIIFLSAHVYLMVLHNLKSFFSFIKQKKKQSETRTGGEKTPSSRLKSLQAVPTSTCSDW